MNQKFKSQFRRRLIQWYQKYRRDLPWRHTRDPYAIWVSEIMLQQTQVATVIPYYRKFLKNLPTLKHLAQAPEEKVLSLWSGLGYYRRARLLQAGAQRVQKEWSGVLPSDGKSLKSIPSIGPYTAGAIASIAFEKCEPLVDGNVIRVLARVFALKGHPKEASLKNQIWSLAKELVEGSHPGDFNQGLMELGATLCRVVLPTCEKCPVAPHCQAKKMGKAENFPEPVPQQKTLQLKRVVAICQKGPQILLVKRKNPRWFKGLWELPHDFIDGRPPSPDFSPPSPDLSPGLSPPSPGLSPPSPDLPPPSPDLPDLCQEFLKNRLGIQLGVPRALPLTRHGITHHRITSYAWSGNVQGNLRPDKHYEMIKFFTIDELSQAPLPSFDRKVLAAGDFLT